MSQSNFSLTPMMDDENPRPNRPVELESTQAKDDGPSSRVYLSVLDRLVSNCADHRADLLKKGKRRLRLKRLANVCAGALALISAGTVAGVLADLLGNKGYQVFAALTAAVSGMITLITNAYLADEETISILEGAAKYLMLRDMVNRTRVAPTMSNVERFSSMERFQGEYAGLDERYSRFL